MEDSRTFIKIFHIEEKRHVASMKGHHDLIHDMAWGADDNTLITASADGSVKLWSTINALGESNEKFNHNANDHLYFLVNLFHPSFVYAAQFFQDTESNGRVHRKIIASACYDQKIRFWTVKLSEANEYMEHHCIMVLDIIDLSQIEN